MGQFSKFSERWGFLTALDDSSICVFQIKYLCVVKATIKGRVEGLIKNKYQK